MRFSKRSRVVFRADGSKEIGFGHVMRCLSLAEVLQEDFKIAFATSSSDGKIHEMISGICSEVLNLKPFKYTPADIGQKFEIPFDMLNILSGNDIVVTDGYFFGTEYQHKIKTCNCKLVSIEDLSNWHYYSDIVINHTEGYNADWYDAEPYTKKFIGFKYALLRQAFLNAQSHRQFTKPGNSIFICLGATEIHQHLSVVLQLLKGEKRKINIVIGNSALLYEKINEYIRQYQLNSTVWKELGADAIIDLMQQSCLSICSPSTIAFEYLCVVNCPLFLTPPVENQKYFYSYLIRNSLGFDFKELYSDSVSPDFDLQNRLFDGLQKLRFKNMFHSLSIE